MRLNKNKLSSRYSQSQCKQIYTYRKNIDVQDDKVECKGKGHRGNEPHVRPRRHGDERLILGQTTRKHKYSHNRENNIIVILCRNML